MKWWLLSLALLVIAPINTWAKNGSGFSYYQKLTGEDSDSDKGRWDALYAKNKGYVYGRDPAPFLAENISTLSVGRALDLGMGEGRNAVFLAKKGFDVMGVDISEVAIRKAKRLAKESNVHISTQTADLTKYQIAPETYDVILVFYYLDRSLVSQIVRGLKPGGAVVFENFTLDQLKHDKGERRDTLLKPGELKTMFKDLQVVKYKEEDNGKEATASLIARKVK